jgi:putative tryptophan/tyrosine transport system substrate-binding protein
MHFHQWKRREFITLLGGAAVAWPIVARAQQPTTPVIGVLRVNPKGNEDFAEPFRRYMQSAGWTEGCNVRYDFVWADMRIERMPALASELVARNVDLIVTFGDPAIRAVQQATSRIPIVGMADDLVASGLVANMARPDGNTTGVSILASELDVKWLEVLREFVPQARTIAILVDPTTNSTRRQLEKAVRDMGVQLSYFEAQDPAQIARALDAIAVAGIDAVNVLASPILNNGRTAIIDRLRQARLPAIYQFPEAAEGGGLLAYGPRQLLAYRHIVSLVDKILHGRLPADLPIEQPVKFELVVNLKTATTIGLTISPSLLLRADEVIE